MAVLTPLWCFPFGFPPFDKSNNKHSQSNKQQTFPDHLRFTPKLFWVQHFTLMQIEVRDLSGEHSLSLSQDNLICELFAPSGNRLRKMQKDWERGERRLDGSHYSPQGAWPGGAKSCTSLQDGGIQCSRVRSGWRQEQGTSAIMENV